MYNLRYHIASLVAVFLALATGLLLGTVVVERGYLDKQRTTLVAGLQSDFAQLRTENAALRRQSQHDRDFALQAMPSLIGGTLKGTRFILVTNQGANLALAPVRDALRTAGADVVVATFASPGLGLASPGATAAVAAVLTTLPAGQPVTDTVASTIAGEWTSPGADPVSDALVHVRQLAFQGPPPDKGLDGVVLLASWNGEADPALVRLASEASRAGVHSVAVETLGAPGAVAGGLSAGLDTVDDVDTPEGALSLAYVLAGKAQGHFGEKPGATAAYPKLR